jgi:hypothetical protein
MWFPLRFDGRAQIAGILRASGGIVRIGKLADLDWSRRRLVEKFRCDIGQRRRRWRG